jgi:hypothetical protein
MAGGRRASRCDTERARFMMLAFSRLDQQNLAFSDRKIYYVSILTNKNLNFGHLKLEEQFSPVIYD